MADIQWIPKCFDYQKQMLRLEEVSDHPLKPAAATSIMEGISCVRRGTLRSVSSLSSSTTRTPTPTQPTASVNSSSHSSLDGSDPLSLFAREELDPLTKMAKDEWDYQSNNVSARDTIEETIESWSSRRLAILSKYTTLEKLSIITSFLPGGEKVVTKVHPTGPMIDKVKTRLEQLDDFEDESVRQMFNLSQAEYVSQIEQLNNELVQAWNSDQRVKALKIAIQCAKLLVDTSAMSFYPSKYVLITDVLDIFGKLVFDRLKVKSEYIKPMSKQSVSLPDNFTPDMVPENAKETCQNWFYKIASIRELVPRLYLEMAIIKSYRFLKTSEINSALQRITKMIRGIGNPLVSIYARCYLCRVGFALGKTTSLDFVKENFQDFLCIYSYLFTPAVKSELLKQNLSLYSYLNLYTPALEWILQLLFTTLSDSQLTEIVGQCKQVANSGLLINTVLTSIKPSYVASHALEFANLIAECEKNGFPHYLLYESLGKALIREPPAKEECQSVLNVVWKYMSSLKDNSRFMQLMEVWIEFTIMKFSSTEVNLFLGAIINHLGPGRNFQHFYPQLQNIVAKLILNAQDFENLLSIDNFLPFIDLFQKESIKFDVCKMIIVELSKQSDSIVDTIMINALMFLMRVIHDSVSALTVEDEKRQIGQLINTLIQRIDYGRDFEKQLNFYVEARGSFSNLDIVHIHLVQCVNRLAVDTRRIIRGHHTRRTSAFVRACAAFCFITIPSLTLVYPKLQLYLLSGQVALLNQCYSQADACFKAALSLVPEMPKMMDIDGRSKSSEPYMLCYLSNFLSTLLVIPDSPEHGVLYLMRGLLNAAQRFFSDNSNLKSQLYLRVLDHLSIAVQESYPYHVDKVDSNDKLYGCDQKFISEVNKISSKVLEELLSHLKYLGSTNQYDKQSILALELFIRMVMRVDLRNPSMAHMAINLWNLSQKSGTIDPKSSIKTLEYVVRKNQMLSQKDNFNDIIKKISK